MVKSTGHNRRLAKKRVQWLIKAFYFVSSSVLVDPEASGLRNQLLYQAPKRYIYPYETTTNPINRDFLDSHSIRRLRRSWAKCIS